MHDDDDAQRHNLLQNEAPHSVSQQLPSFVCSVISFIFNFLNGVGQHTIFIKVNIIVYLLIRINREVLKAFQWIKQKFLKIKQITAKFELLRQDNTDLYKKPNKKVLTCLCDENKMPGCQGLLCVSTMRTISKVKVGKNTAGPRSWQSKQFPSPLIRQLISTVEINIFHKAFTCRTPTFKLMIQ